MYTVYGGDLAQIQPAPLLVYYIFNYLTVLLTIPRNTHYDGQSWQRHKAYVSNTTKKCTCSLSQSFSFDG